MHSTVNNTVLEYLTASRFVRRCMRFNRVVSKTKHSKTKTEARSTQNSKTKHPKLENEAPKIENEAPKTRKRSTQNTRHRSALYKHETNVNTAEIKGDNEYSITNRMQFKSSQAPKNSKTKHPNLENEAPKTRKRSTQNSKTKHPKNSTLVCPL